MGKAVFACAVVFSLCYFANKRGLYSIDALVPRTILAPSISHEGTLSHGDIYVAERAHPWAIVVPFHAAQLLQTVIRVILVSPIHESHNSPGNLFPRRTSTSSINPYTPPHMMPRVLDATITIAVCLVRGNDLAALWGVSQIEISKSLGL